MWVQFVSPFYRERNPGTKKSQGSKSHAGTQGTTGKLAKPDFRVTAFNAHVTEATREIIKVRPVLKDFIWLLMAILCSPPTAPWAHHSCNDAGPTGEERDAWRSQAPHPGPTAGHSADCSRVQALEPSGAPASSYNTLSRCFVCLFVFLFLIFVAVSMNSSVLAGEAEMEQQQKIKLIRNTFQLRKPLGELKKENKQPWKGYRGYELFFSTFTVHLAVGQCYISRYRSPTRAMEGRGNGSAEVSGSFWDGVEDPAGGIFNAFLMFTLHKSHCCYCASVYPFVNDGVVPTQGLNFCFYKMMILILRNEKDSAQLLNMDQSDSKLMLSGPKLSLNLSPFLFQKCYA